MKFKDIEDKIKNEIDGISVPDVYSRVRKAPIHKLLTGENPKQAFKKKLAIMLLFLTVVIFAVMSVAIFAFANQTETESPSDSYICVKVENGGAATVYGLIADSQNRVLCVINQTTQQTDTVLDGYTLSAAITVLYIRKSSDSVSISVLNDASDFSRNLAEELKSCLINAYGDTEYTVTADSNGNAEKLELVNFINSAQGTETVTADMNIATLSAKYTALAQNLVQSA